MMITNLGTEFLYAFVIIICSLMIYFGTKEIYSLSKHEGIKYFRLAFLFFAFAYFSRTFIRAIVFYFNSNSVMSIPPHLLNPLVGILSLFLFVYLSTMAIFYLLFSVICKKWNKKEPLIFLLHLLAFLISFVITISGNTLFYLVLNLGLFIVVLFVISISKKGSTSNAHKTTIYPIYILLSFFLILNIIDILLPAFFQTTQILIYMASSGIFLLILYRVLNKVGN